MKRKSLLINIISGNILEKYITSGGIFLSSSFSIRLTLPVILWCLLPNNRLGAQIPTGPEIIEKMTEVMSPQNSKGVAIQTILTTSGKKRTFEFEMYSANRGERTLIRYRKPTRVKGQAILLLNHSDDIWTYFPRTRRVRKLASHARKQKVQGSDFTYEDMGSGDTWKNDYTSTNLGSKTLDKMRCWKVEALEKPGSKAAYPKVILWVRQDNFYPVQMEYYNEKDHLIKTLFLKDIRVIEEFPTAMQMVMKNHEKGTETRMEIVSMSYSWEPPKGFFSERNLKQ